MVSFKGILKYLIYVFIAGWMFLLGIMVGRGTSPVTFDTQKFQKRLEVIASDFGKKEGTQKEMDLKFYNVLDHPVAEEGLPSPKKNVEIIPKKETTVTLDKIPLKISLKEKTYKKKRPRVKPDIKMGQSENSKGLKPPDVKSKSTVAKKNNPPLQVKDKKGQNGRYTLQIAAYKAFKDAVSQMAILEKKGFDSYRVKGEKDGTIWYRVRAGSFATYEDAKQFKEKLKKARINSIILKKDSDEDIKG